MSAMHVVLTQTLQRLSLLRSHQVLRALALLGAAVASLVMAVLLGSDSTELGAFLTKNEISTLGRDSLLLAPMVSALLTIGGGVIAVLARKDRAIGVLEKSSQLLSPLLVVWALPVLTQQAVWYTRPLDFLLMLALFVLGLERALRLFLVAFPAEWLGYLERPLGRIRGRWTNWVPLTIVLLGALGYSVFCSYYAILEHHRLTTGTLDMGISDNLMFNAMRGKFFRVPALLPDGSLMLKGHALFGMFFFLPFYALYPSSEAMIVIQATMLGFGALPLYLFARTRLSRGVSCVVACAYLLSPLIHGATFFDFHFLPLAVPLHFWLHYAIARKKPWLTGIVWFALVAMREDISAGLAILGIVLVLSGVRVGYGLAIAAASSVMFVIIKFVIMPAAGEWFFADIYNGLYVPGEKSYGSVIKTLISNPALTFTSLVKESKLIFGLHVFAPIAFLPWRRACLVLATLAAFPFTLMVTQDQYILDIGFHYVTHWVPYVFSGSVLALALMKRGRVGTAKVWAGALALAAGISLHSWVFGAILQHDNFHAGLKLQPFEMTDAERADYEALVEVRKHIPPDAVVAATPQMYPHISNRVDAYDLENSRVHAEYLLISPRAVHKCRVWLSQLVRQESYGLVEKRGTIYLFKRGHESPESARAWRELGIVYPRH